MENSKKIIKSVLISFTIILVMVGIFKFFNLNDYISPDKVLYMVELRVGDEVETCFTNGYVINKRTNCISFDDVDGRRYFCGEYKITRMY